jgi:hypothetical protein
MFFLVNHEIIQVKHIFKIFSLTWLVHLYVCTFVRMFVTSKSKSIKAGHEKCVRKIICSEGIG